MESKHIDHAWNGKANCKDCAIRQMVLFADLDQSDFNLIHHPINELQLEKGETLYKEGDSPQAIYTIRSGMIKLVHYLADGSFRIVRVLRQGDVTGMEALDNKNYLQHAIVLETASLCQIPVKEIESINQRSPRLFKQLNNRWQRVIFDADLWITSFTTGFARQRVAHLLLYIANDGDGEQCFLPSREDIGAILSITTETASRIIAEFKREGIIETRPSHYAKLDIAVLKKAIS